MPQGAGLEVDEPGGIEGRPPVTGLEMQVRSGGSAGRAAQADDVTGAYPVAGLDIPAGQVAVEGLQPIGMADDHQVAVAAHIIGDADLAVKGGSHRRSGGIGEVDTLVPAAVPVAEERARMGLVRAVVAVQGVHNPEAEAVGQGRRLLAVGIHGARVPALGKYTVLHHGGRIFHETVGAVAVEHDFHGRIAGIQRIGIIGSDFGGRLHLAASEGVAQGVGLSFGRLGPDNGPAKEQGRYSKEDKFT